MPELWLFCLPFPIKLLTSRDFSFKFVSEVVFVELGSRGWFSGLGAGGGAMQNIMLSFCIVSE